MKVLPPDIGSVLALLFTKLCIHDSCVEIIYALFKVDVVKEFVRCFLKWGVSRELFQETHVPPMSIPCASRVC